LLGAYVCASTLTGCALPRTSDDPLAHAVDYARYVIVTIKNEPTNVAPRAGASVRSYAGAQAYGVTQHTRSAVRSIAAAYGLRETTAWPIELLGIHCVVFEIPLDMNREDALSRLRMDRRVDSAQPLQSFSTLNTTASGDPYRRLQRNLDWMHVDEAHRWSLGAGVSVGVVDTGVDAAHPDLAGRIVHQTNFVGDRSDDVYPDRHGTAVAGLIGAAADNHQGIIGIAPQARLYALRACWASENGTRASCSSLTLAKALTAAIEARLQVVNLSLAGPADPLLTRIVQVGQKRGIVFVGATPPSDPRTSFPTNIAGVLAAGVSGEDRGADATLFAPGRDVLTLMPGGGYDFASGASLAAASISGAVALLLARNRTLPAEEARRLLAGSTRHFASDSGEQLASVDLCAALSALAADVVCSQRGTSRQARR
jgi:subtilisin family serine protease